MEGHDYDKMFKIGLTFGTCIAALVIGPKLFREFSRLLRWIGIGERDAPLDDVAEIKKTTLQITKDWVGMVKLITGLRQDQADFGSTLQEHMEAQTQTLCQTIIESLEDEFLRNDQRFSKVMRAVEAMQEDMLFLKNSFKSAFYQSGGDGIARRLVDGFAQTEYEMKTKSKENTKSSISNEQETVKIDYLVKKCLVDLLSDAKLCLYNDREEENKELEMIFLKLAEDREITRNSIAHAFAIAAAEAKKNFENIGHMGQEAVQYMSTLYENTNRVLTIKLEETDDRLKDILNGMNSQALDVVSIRNILENIDGQFDHIFQKVELGCLRNTECSEEIAQHLGKASCSWESTAAQLGTLRKDFVKDMQSLKETLVELKQAKEQKTEDGMIVGYDSSIHLADQQMLPDQERCAMLMLSVIQTCWDKMTRLNDSVEMGCVDICKMVDELFHKLHSLNASVGKLEETVAQIDADGFVNGSHYFKCSDLDAEGMLSVEKSGNGDSGDYCQPIRPSESGILGPTRERKIQKYAAILREKEITIIEQLLQKACQDSKATNSVRHKGANSQKKHYPKDIE